MAAPATSSSPPSSAARPIATSAPRPPRARARPAGPGVSVAGASEAIGSAIALTSPPRPRRRGSILAERAPLASLPACPTCLPACLPACLPVCLSSLWLDERLLVRRGGALGGQSHAAAGR